jgi:GT2 family glycosyltransferase
MTVPAAGAPAPRLGVITVTYNAAAFLRPFLACCLAQTCKDFELLVVDNASVDKTLAIMSEVTDARVQLLRNERNLGYPAACNQGAHHFLDRGVSDILFINNDTEFDPGLFEGLLTLRALHGADAITPRITFAQDTNINWYAGGRLTFWKGFQGEMLGEGRPNDPSDIEARWTPVATGCCLMAAAATLKRIGTFDENYFVYFEDTDYSIRMKRAGLRLLYASALTVAHKVSQSTGGPLSKFSIRYYQRNQIYCLRKHFSWWIVTLQLALLFFKATARMLTRRDTFDNYLLRLRSTVEGMKIPIRR